MNVLTIFQGSISVLLPGIATIVGCSAVLWSRIGPGLTLLAQEVPAFLLILFLVTSIVSGLLVTFVSRSVEPVLHWLLQLPSLDHPDLKVTYQLPQETSEKLETLLKKRWNESCLSTALKLTAHELARDPHSTVTFQMANCALQRNMLVVFVISLACLLANALLLVGTLFLIWLSFLLLATPLPAEEKHRSVAAVRGSFCLLGICIFLVGFPAGWPWSLGTFQLVLVFLVATLLITGFQYKRYCLLLLESILIEGAARYSSQE